jgi:hypothetical protein
MINDQKVGPVLIQNLRKMKNLYPENEVKKKLKTNKPKL